MKMPSFIFEGVKTVFVKDITVENAEEWNAATGKIITELIKENINNAEIGVVKGYKISLPWMSTNLYQLVTSESEADLVISGTVRSSFTKNDEVKEKGKYNTKIHKLPYFVKSYERKKDADAAIDLYFTNKSGVAIKTYSNMNMTYTFSKEYLGAPKLTDKGDYVDEIPDNELTMKCLLGYLKSIKMELTPRLVKKEYEVKKVRKIKDKMLDKKQKEAYKLTKKNNYAEAANLYSEVADNAVDKRVVLVAAKYSGILYMLSGNFEKSEIYLKKAGDNTLSSELMKMKNIHQQLKGLGRL